MTGYQILWLFLCYSFAGWILETVVATLRQRRITNRGLINGPFCIIYGISAVLITITVQELTGVALFLFSAVYATVVELFGCKMEPGRLRLPSCIHFVGCSRFFRGNSRKPAAA